MTATITAQIGTTDWNLTEIRKTFGTPCDHCGRTLKHMYVVTHRVTGKTMTVGRGCCKKVTGWTLAAADAAQLLRAAAEEARQGAVWDEFTNAHPEDARMLEADIRAWRPERPGQVNLPAHVKYDIVRGATPRSWWAGRICEYRRTRQS